MYVTGEAVIFLMNVLNFNITCRFGDASQQPWYRTPGPVEQWTLQNMICIWKPRLCSLPGNK